MIYSNFGRVVLAVVILLCVIFLRRPWKSFFVYPWKTRQGKLFALRSTVRILSVLAVVLRSFDIQRINGSTIVQTPQRDVMFMLDGSLSMSADDAQPNRFARATSLIADIVSWLSWTQSSLIVFSWLPVIRVPRTQDRQGFVQVLSGMKLGEFPPTEGFLWTALGDALLLSLQQFSLTDPSNTRALVIISDGDSNKGYNPYAIIPLLQERHIPVYFIAIGQEGYKVGIDRTWLPVITSFDTDLIEQFTTETNGRLFFNPDAQEVQQLSDILAAREAKDNVHYIPHTYHLNADLAPILLICFSLLSVLLIGSLRSRSTRWNPLN